MTPILNRRFAPLTGAAFFVLILVALITEGSPPAADDATDDVVRWWTDNDTRSLAAAQVTHTLSVLSELFFIPFAMGLLVALLATSVVILRHGGLLPRWIGFVAIVIAIVLLTPAYLGAAIATAIWILCISVVLFLREG